MLGRWAAGGGEADEGVSKHPLASRRSYGQRTRVFDPCRVGIFDYGDSFGDFHDLSQIFHRKFEIIFILGLFCTKIMGKIR